MWVPVSERLPSVEVFGNYPVVEVVRQCVSKDGDFMNGQQTIAVAELRFVGGQVDRYYWTKPKGFDSINYPIENDSWIVTHWRPYPQDLPAPIPLTKNAYGSSK